MFQFGRTIALSVIVGLVALAGSGCDQGLKIGDSWLIRPRGPLSATQLHISKFTGSYASASRSNQGMLVVDLLDGKTTLTDPQGRVFPSQLPPQMADELRDVIGGRRYKVASVKPRPHAPNVHHYVLTILDGDKRVGSVTRWPTPTADELRRSLELITRIYDRADRMANPLSIDLNLLK